LGLTPRFHPVDNRPAVRSDFVCRHGGWHLDTAKILLRQHGVAAGTSLAALLLAIVTASWSDRAVFMLFMGAVVVCGYFGGLRPGALATGITALCLIAQFLFLPADSPRRNVSDFIAGLFLYAAVGMLVSYLGSECRHALAELNNRRSGESELSQQLAAATQGFRERENQLQAQISERQRNEQALRREREKLQAEWEAADQKLLKEVNDLRQQNQQAQKQLADRQQVENALRNQLAEVTADRGNEDKWKQQIDDLQTEIQLLREEQGEHEARLKHTEEEFRREAEELENARRRAEDELDKQKAAEDTLRQQIDQTDEKHRQELAQWEQLLQDADTEREAYAAKLAAAEAALQTHADEYNKRIDEVSRENRAAEDRFDALVDRLHEAAGCRSFRLVAGGRFETCSHHELIRRIERYWVLNRMKRGNLTLHMQPLELDGLIDRTVRSTADVIELKAQHLTVSLPLDTHWLWADAVRLQQALVEILIGASERGESGARIEMVAELHDDDIQLRVTDRDSDISPDDVARLGESRDEPDILSSCQSDSEAGMAMARRVTELHGGQFTVSQPNAGTGMEIVCRLPALPREHSVMVAANGLSAETVAGS
jgi:K+-sensing histidine kinase KdpD